MERVYEIGKHREQSIREMGLGIVMTTLFLKYSIWGNFATHKVQKEGQRRQQQAQNDQQRKCILIYATMLQVHKQHPLPNMIGCSNHADLGRGLGTGICIHVEF